MAVLTVAAFAASACSGDSSIGESTPTDAAAPTILATTGIWADVVANVACDGLAEVETIIPIGGDPHGYEPSLQDRARMESAALVVVNGLGLEAALQDTLDAVAESGTPVFEFAHEMDTIPFSSENDAHADEGHADEDDDHTDEDDDHTDEDDDHTDEDDDHTDEDHADEDEAHTDDDHADDDHADEEDDHDDDDHADEDAAHTDDDHADEDDAHADEEDAHDHSGGDDPHVWFDPHRVSEALPSLAQVLTAEVGLDAAAVEACMAGYSEELEAVDAEIAAAVEGLPTESRKLVTNHEALGYFADRYGFTVIGTVIPSPSSMAQTSPAQLEELAEIIEHEGIAAIFAETQHSVDDIEALAGRVGDVDVVTLYTGSLGPPGSGAETYVGYLQTNTELIVDALS